MAPTGFFLPHPLHCCHGALPTAPQLTLSHCHAPAALMSLSTALAASDCILSGTRGASCEDGAPATAPATTPCPVAVTSSMAGVAAPPAAAPPGRSVLGGVLAEAARARAKRSSGFFLAARSASTSRQLGSLKLSVEVGSGKFTSIEISICSVATSSISSISVAISSVRLSSCTSSASLALAGACAGPTRSAVSTRLWSGTVASIRLWSGTSSIGTGSSLPVGLQAAGSAMHHSMWFERDVVLVDKLGPGDRDKDLQQRTLVSSVPGLVPCEAERLVGPADVDAAAEAGGVAREVQLEPVAADGLGIGSRSAVVEAQFAWPCALALVGGGHERARGLQLAQVLQVALQLGQHAAAAGSAAAGSAAAGSSCSGRGAAPKFGGGALPATDAVRNHTGHIGGPVATSANSSSGAGRMGSDAVQQQLLLLCCRLLRCLRRSARNFGRLPS
eukprot:scaffold84111_cov60-Phaeocystis_antarctica.AAC.1